MCTDIKRGAFEGKPNVKRIRKSTENGVKVSLSVLSPQHSFLLWGASCFQVSLCLTVDGGAGLIGNIGGDPLEGGGHPAVEACFHLARPLTAIETALIFL
ncbi:MAG: hypothetical protein ACLQJ7_11860 [Syntrophobacteraceae bacterium]